MPLLHDAVFGDIEIGNVRPLIILLPMPAEMGPVVINSIKPQAKLIMETVEL